MSSKFDYKKKVQFSLNDNFIAVVNHKVEYKNQTEPLELSDDVKKVEKYRLVAMPGVFSTLEKVVDKDDDLVVKGEEVEYFSEALNCFVHNWLLKDHKEHEIGRTYYKKDDDQDVKEGGFMAKVMEKDKYITLGIFVGEKIYYLSKYDCRVIIASLQKINHKCGLEPLRAQKMINGG